MENLVQLQTPYLLFLGDVTEQAFAKIALGLAQWAPDKCMAQMRLNGCTIDTGLPDLDIHSAVQCGARSFVIGGTPVGGRLPDSWEPIILNAISQKMDIINGLHDRLNTNPAICAAAKKHDVRLIDVRVPPSSLPIANGKKRTGKRLLTVGTDCAVGKKYTALTVNKALRAYGISSSFKATGQTGIVISGQGIPIDSVVGDFIAGAAELISPDNDNTHWDVIEGQGSLFSPSYAGVSLGLLHGSQPDAIILCHDPARAHIIGCPEYSVPGVNLCIKRHLEMGAWVNPEIKCVGISVNSSTFSSLEKERYFDELRQETHLPVVDPLADGVEPIIQRIFETHGINADSLLSRVKA